jgi:hypothetical protein
VRSVVVSIAVAAIDFRISVVDAEKWPRIGKTARFLGRQDHRVNSCHLSKTISEGGRMIALAPLRSLFERPDSIYESALWIAAVDIIETWSSSSSLSQSSSQMVHKKIQENLDVSSLSSCM